MTTQCRTINLSEINNYIKLVNIKKQKHSNISHKHQIFQIKRIGGGGDDFDDYWRGYSRLIKPGTSEWTNQRTYGHCDRYVTTFCQPINSGGLQIFAVTSCLCVLQTKMYDVYMYITICINEYQNNFENDIFPGILP